MKMYGYNSSSPRIELWDKLASLPNIIGLVCGDFNMVLKKEASATGSALCMAGEQERWRLAMEQHALEDVWNMVQPSSPGFTYNFVSHH